MTATYPRRHFLKTSAAAAAGGALLGGPFQGLVARAVGAAPGDKIDGYGPLSPTPDETTGLALLSLPAGFQYWSFGWTGEPMDDGYPTPNRHDGMAAFGAGPGASDGRANGRGRGLQSGDRVLLVRNHERGYDTATQNANEALIGNPAYAYDPIAGGGCTTLVWNTATKQLERSFISINGTSVNCAGGPIRGSWYTCEETTEGVATYGTNRGGFQRDHGYVFEVPAGEDVVVTDPQPIRDMGRFRHEAVSQDDRTGHYFLTEDSGSSSGFYRFVARNRNRPELGGRLQMLAVTGEPGKDLGAGYPILTTFPVTWVDIAQPDPAIGYSFPRPGAAPFVVDAKNMEEAVFEQGLAGGGARMSRLEGLWYDAEVGKHYFTSTSGGAAELGQVWEYDDVAQVLRLVFESDSASELESPDNLTVSPRSGLVLCEDGDVDNFLRGLTDAGEIYDFARNDIVIAAGDSVPGTAGPDDYRDKEFAGACFSPDGQWLFVNVQTPGVTFAITGPWQRGLI